MTTQTSFQSIIVSTAPTFVLGPQAPIPLDLRRFHFGAAIICSIGANSSASYWVELTGDLGGRIPFVNWNTHDILGGGTYPPTPVTQSANTNLAFPATAIRLNIAALTGTLTMSLVMGIGTS